MRRRTFLRGTGAALAGSVAGCGGLLQTRSIRSPPVLEDRPDAVYYPTHVEGMWMAGMATSGRYACALSVSFPHRFWLVNGARRTKVTIGQAESVHLMATVWDRETETVLHGADVTLRVERDREVVAEKPPWPMLSQNMGVHRGDNYALPGGGTYGVTVEVGPVATRRTGALAGAFADRRALSFELDFSRSALQELPFRELPEKQGTPGAVAPMEMGMTPTSQVPSIGELPGSVLGDATTGDAVLVVVRLESPPAGIDADGQYLAVSARTPYNRYPLPMMTLSARIDRDGSTIFEDYLRPTLDPDLGHHYGAVVESLEAGDDLALAPGAPPQIARHEGYETAFLRMDDVTLAVGE